MKLTKNSYGYNVPKYDYEKLQNEVEQRNKIRINALIEFNKILEKVEIDTIPLDGYKPSKELTKTNAKGMVYDSRVNRLPAPFKNPYDRSFEGLSEDESFKVMEEKIKEFYAVNPHETFDNLGLKMKREFETKVTDFVERSINPIRFTLLNKIKNMSVEEFIKIYFRWYNNIGGENVFAPNYVINQWAWYFDIETKNEYDMITDEDMNELYKKMPKQYYKQDDDDKTIRQHFYDLYN